MCRTPGSGPASVLQSSRSCVPLSTEVLRDQPLDEPGGTDALPSGCALIESTLHQGGVNVGIEVDGKANLRDGLTPLAHRCRLLPKFSANGTISATGGG